MKHPTVEQAVHRLRIFQIECEMGEGRLMEQRKFAADLKTVLDALSEPKTQIDKMDNRKIQK